MKHHLNIWNLGFIWYLGFVFWNFIGLPASAQISEGGIPLSFNLSELKTSNIKPQTVSMPAVNHKQMLYEDSLEAVNKTVPLRFGKDMDVNLNTDNSGTWQTVSNGDRIWRLGIRSDGAYSLNFIFNKFRLPKWSKLYIYSSDKSSVIGAFTEKNNRNDGIFATTIIKGDYAIIEYYEPANTREKVVIELSKVIHAYRNLWKQAEDYSGSGSCNINVNCPEGLPWYNEKRAVAMILQSNNSRICTGTLLNNVRQDCTPYFLTANHCTQGENVNTWIFMFNYESQGCTSQDGPTNQTLQGATLLATDTPSDFALLQLSTPPPSNYNVYFAGWTAVDAPSDSCAVMHHPSGDIKKISLETALIVSTDWASGSPNSHWDVPFYIKGTTEAGSSGSALFDKNHKIKGQLHGGTASCSSITDDYYGKFSYSWNMGSTSSTRLKDWLDPDNTGITVLDGKDCNHPLYPLDAAIIGIVTPESGEVCDSNITPEIIVRNNGSHTLKKADIYYRIDKNNYTKFSWNGSIKYLYSASIKLNPVILNKGNHTFTVYITNPNDSTDNNHTNDTAHVTFDYVRGKNIVVTLKTDNFANETSWVIRDSGNHTIYTNPPLISATLYNTTLCLTPGCYDFTIFDSMGDGMCAITNTDTAYVTIANGNTIIGHLNGCNFDTSYTIHFCVKASVQTLKPPANSLEIFPNPVYQQLNLNFISANHLSATGYIYSIEGKLVRTFTVNDNKKLTIELPDLNSGIYFLKVQNNDVTFKKKFIVIK